MEKLDYNKVYILPIGEVLERREKGERPFADIWEGAYHWEFLKSLPKETLVRVEYEPYGSDSCEEYGSYEFYGWCCQVV